jgi:hypothetical protein
MSRGDPDDDRAAYELRVNGRLGPVLLGALPHAAVSRVPRHTLRITVDDTGDLVGVLKKIVDTGVEVDAVRKVTSGHDGPEPA